MSDLQLETLHAVDQYWANVLSCPVGTLRPKRGIAVPHTGLGDYAGIYAIAIGDGLPIVSVPPDLLDAAERIAPTWTSTSIQAPTEFAVMLDDRAGLVLGPARISYCDRNTFRPTAASHDARVLSPAADTDVRAVDELRRACSAADWEAGGTALQERDAVGVFVDGALVALAGYEEWGERLAHISVVTHPNHRGRSLGTLAVSALTSRLLAFAFVPQYRTLEANTASLRIGTRLGFVGYGTSMAIRLRVG